MKFCTDCWNFDRCNAIGRVVDFSVDDGVCRDFDECKPQTNADRIRAMSDEELAEFLTHINPTNCQDCAFSHGWCCQPDRDDYSDFKKCEEGRKRWLQQTPKGE